MTQVTVELNDMEEKVVNVVKALKGHKSKEKAIKDLINEYGQKIEIEQIIEKLNG